MVLGDIHNSPQTLVKNIQNQFVVDKAYRFKNLNYSSLEAIKFTYQRSLTLISICAFFFSFIL